MLLEDNQLQWIWNSDVILGQLSVITIYPPVLLQLWETTWRPSHLTSPSPTFHTQQTWATAPPCSTPPRWSCIAWWDAGPSNHWWDHSCVSSAPVPDLSAHHLSPTSPAWILVPEEQSGPLLLSLQTDLPQVRPFSEHLPVKTTSGVHPFLSSHWPLLCFSLFLAPRPVVSRPLSWVPTLSLPRPEKDGATTSVDVVCTYHPDPVSHRLDIEQLYWELRQLTHDVTQLGFYTLVKDSLFINGECLCWTWINSDHYLSLFYFISSWTSQPKFYLGSTFQTSMGLVFLVSSGK